MSLTEGRRHEPREGWQVLRVNYRPVTFYLTRLALVAAFAISVGIGAAASSGSVLRFAVPEPNSLNPLLATQASENALNMAIFSGLVVLDDRENVLPDLVQELPSRRNGGISRDGRTITYVLRPNLTW